MSNPREIAHTFFSEIATLSLATCSDDKPWAATVFFAADKNLNLYFVSDHRTRHGRDITTNERVAATVNPEVDNWHDVRGLQIEGRVEVVTGALRLKALALYLQKFPQIDALYASPKSENEETIAKRLQAANIYRIQPDLIRVIDNEQGFGYREEFDPRDPE